MLRFYITTIILFFLSSCATTSSDREQVIPDSKITGKPNEGNAAEDNKLNVAVLVPLSKNNEELGKYLLKSAQLALIEAHNPDINLIPMDSNMIKGDPSLLVNKLVEQKVKVVLGPVYGHETEKLVSLLKYKDITILSLSNDSSIKSDSLLTLGISPDSQATILTHYAISQEIDKFYLLLPSTKYGKLIDNAVNNVVSTKDGASHTTSWYSTENAEQVTDELISSIKQNKSEAIFMPQGGHNIAILNSKLEQHKLKIKLMGTQAWDHPNILKFPLFDGAILLRHQISNEKFHQEYHKLFKAKPSNLDLIAYNGFMLVANMHKANLSLDKRSIVDNNQEFDKYAEVKFTPEGVSIYKMSVIEVHDGHFKIMANPQ